MRKFLSLIIFAVFLFVSCQPVSLEDGTPTDSSNSNGKEPMSMVFMGGYIPQANLPFVAVYVAQEKGFFAEENLDVEIQHSTSGEHVQLLTAGKVQVTNMDAAVLLEHRADPGLPIVSIALIGQKGQQAFVALKSQGFETPKDWEGHSVGYKGTIPPDLYALLNATSADVDKIDLINVGYDPRLLVEGKVDVYPVFKSNEPYQIAEWDYEIDMWDATDYGVPMLGLTYVTSEKILEENPEMLTRFMRAVIRGIEYAADHPEEAIDFVLKYTGPEADRDHMMFMFQTELKDAYSEGTQEHSFGWQTLEQWQALADVMYQYKAMPELDVSKAFTNDILKAAMDE